jgi:macrolide transport system ATP-binding/permease protein
MIPWYRRLAWRLQRSRRESILREELEFHLNEEAQERRGDGLSAGDAAWAARRDLGNLTQLREEARALWSWTLLEQFAQDLRFAMRTMLKNRMVTAMAALTLALGIGANTAIYSFMDALLLRTLPVPAPESLLAVKWHARAIDFRPRDASDPSTFVLHSINGQVYDENGGSTSRVFPYPAFERLQATASPVMTSLFAYHPAGRLNVVARGEADITLGEYVSGNYFDGLRVTPAAGRPIVMDDDRAGAEPVAVISMGYARRRFGDAASAVSQTIRVANVAYTVVGVAPAEFYGVDPSVAPDLYLPLHRGEVDPDPNSYWLEMMGRLRPGVNAARAQAVLGPMFDRWVETTVTTDRERLNLPRLRLDPGATGLDTLRRRYSEPLTILIGMVALVLVIACANTANLLLARAAARQREMAVRLSIGAGGARLLRQLLTEGVCLAGLAGALSLPIAIASMRLLSALLDNGQQTLPLQAEINWRVLLVTLGLSLLCGLVFGLAPALQAARPSLMPILKGPGDRIARASDRAATRLTLTQLLVVAQIAISLVLLVGAGLFVRTLANLKAMPLGFDTTRLLLFDVNARQSGHDAPAIGAFYDDLRRRLAGAPGVAEASLSHASLIRAGRSLSIQIAGAPVHGARILDVGPGFFATMGIRVVEGRAIDERDVPGRAPVAVVSALFARTFFDGRSAVGQTLTLDLPLQAVGPSGRGQGEGAPLDLEIVGVAAEAQYGDLRDTTPPVVYLPYRQVPYPPITQMTYALRTATDPLASVATVRQLVRQADPELPITNVRTQTLEIDRAINQEILFARLCTAFAVLALVIACVGLYGTMAYRVTRRTNEIGIRMALGAGSRRVAWMVLREVCTLAAIGLAISLPVALAASRLVDAFLFNVRPNDPATIAVAVVVLVSAVIAAGYGPARRAARISPMTALRVE